MSFVRSNRFWALVLTLVPLVAQGQEEGRTKTYILETDALSEQFRDISQNLRCPTCTGLSVLESDAAFSVQIKDLVQEQVEAGKSKADILDYFEQRYGPWILRSPPKTGFNLLAWGIPLGLLVLGPVMLWILIWRRKTVVDTLGARSDDAIIKELEDRLTTMRTAR